MSAASGVPQKQVAHVPAAEFLPEARLILDGLDREAIDWMAQDLADLRALLQPLLQVAGSRPRLGAAEAGAAVPLRTLERFVVSGLTELL